EAATEGFRGGTRRRAETQRAKRHHDDADHREHPRIGEPAFGERGAAQRQALEPAGPRGARAHAAAPRHNASASPAKIVAPTQWLCRNARNSASRSRCRLMTNSYTTSSSATPRPIQYHGPSCASRPTSASAPKNSAYSTPCATRSRSPNRIAVDFAPMRMSSSRSTIAYQVSYAVDH